MHKKNLTSGIRRLVDTLILPPLKPRYTMMLFTQPTLFDYDDSIAHARVALSFQPPHDKRRTMSEMAKRYRRDVPTDATGLEIPVGGEVGAAPSATDIPQREPASLGKLHEIDLGQETKLQNIVRTEAATRRLVGDDEDVHSKNDGSFSRTARVEKDERTWCHRKQRTSQDVERDRLVEEVLRESKLDVYEEPEGEAAAAAAGDDQAADDRVAEQFRKDFLDAIQSRRRVTRAKNTKTTKAEPSRGPKLGGSRSARAAMREMQEKQGQGRK
ncbi:hypothetical protein BBP40_008810 [Aspergillus hancockii]|nr:hypothetical protein BBP40_008810 [Aspergillus hancockii]